jgi:hypothetical protein
MVRLSPGPAGRAAHLASPVAKLAISIARKAGALIFLVPEDIVDVRPRLVRLFCPKLSSVR